MTGFEMDDAPEPIDPAGVRRGARGPRRGVPDPDGAADAARRAGAAPLAARGRGRGCRASPPSSASTTGCCTSPRSSPPGRWASPRWTSTATATRPSGPRAPTTRCTPRAARRRVGAVGPRPAARGPLVLARDAPRGDARPADHRLLPGPRLRLPRASRLGAAAARPARLGPRPRQLRHPSRVRARGVRAHRPRQRRPTRVQPAGDGRGSCSRPATCAPARGSSNRRPGSSPRPGSPTASPTPCAAARSCGAASTSSPSRLVRARRPDPRRRRVALRARRRREPRPSAAGSVGPWEPGGISEFQWRAGEQLARVQGRPYEPFGAAVS